MRVVKKSDKMDKNLWKEKPRPGKHENPSPASSDRLDGKLILALHLYSMRFRFLFFFGVLFFFLGLFF